MSLHKDLTGADLHEPKGAESASQYTVYSADGAGSGAWSKIGVNHIDTAAVKDLNKYKLFTSFTNVSTADQILVPITVASTLVTVTFTLNGPITAANATVNLVKNSASTIGSQVIAFSGSGEGTTFTFTAVTNSTFAPGDYLKITNAAGSTGAQRLSIVMDFIYV